MENKKLTNYLDKNFDKLIKRYDELAPDKFFNTKWEDCEEVPIYSRYSHISFLNRFSQEEKDLYLLKYSLKHLNTLVNYFCKTSDIGESDIDVLMDKQVDSSETETDNGTDDELFGMD